MVLAKWRPLQRLGPASAGSFRGLQASRSRLRKMAAGPVRSLVLGSMAIGRRARFLTARSCGCDAHTRSTGVRNVAWRQKPSCHDPGPGGAYRSTCQSLVWPTLIGPRRKRRPSPGARGVGTDTGDGHRWRRGKETRPHTVSGGGGSSQKPAAAATRPVRSAVRQKEERTAGSSRANCCLPAVAEPHHVALERELRARGRPRRRALLNPVDDIVDAVDGGGGLGRAPQALRASFWASRSAQRARSR